jgi:hypothetical protein
MAAIKQARFSILPGGEFACVLAYYDGGRAVGVYWWSRNPSFHIWFYWDTALKTWAWDLVGWRTLEPVTDGVGMTIGSAGSDFSALWTNQKEASKGTSFAAQLFRRTAKGDSADWIFTAWAGVFIDGGTVPPAPIAISIKSADGDNLAGAATPWEVLVRAGLA